jgi:hypothetical protein
LINGYDYGYNREHQAQARGNRGELRWFCMIGRYLLPIFRIWLSEQLFRPGKHLITEFPSNSKLLIDDIIGVRALSYDVLCHRDGT